MPEAARISAEAFKAGTVRAHIDAERQLKAMGEHGAAVQHEYEQSRLLRESVGGVRKEPLREKAEYSNRHREILEARNKEAQRIKNERVQRSAHHTEIGNPAHQQAALQEAHTLMRGPKGGSFYIDKGRKVYAKK